MEKQNQTGERTVRQSFCRAIKSRASLSFFFFFFLSVPPNFV